MARAISAPTAENLTGTTLASSVTASSLTSVGVLTALSVTGLVDIDNRLRFDTGVAVTAGEYAIQRDADATNQLHFNVPTGASFEFSVNDVAELLLTATNLTPGANDGNALGSATVSWADLFLASGAVINFDNGNLTLTHSAGAMAATGAWTFSGASVSITGTTGNTLIVDTNVLVVDATNNRVGIGTDAPGAVLHVVGSSILAGTVLVVSGVVTVQVGSAASPSYDFQGDEDTGFFSSALGVINISTNGVERARFTDVGQLKIAGTANRATTEGTNHLDIFDGTAPVGTLTDGISLYSTLGELRVMDAGGTATLLSPHDEAGYWVFDSKNSQTGQRLVIHMERFMRNLEEHFGWNCIEELVET